MATHSSEILRAADPAAVLQIRSDRKPRYLTSQDQKVGLLEGLGSDYAPRIDRIRVSKRIFFHEGSSDLTILKALSKIIDESWPDQWVEWQSTGSHKERRSLWRSLQEELGPISVVSLRDRDDEALETIDDQLRDRTESRQNESLGFCARKWRRRYIEAYLIWPPTLAECSGRSEQDVRTLLQDQFGIAIGSSFVESYAPQALLDIRAKDVLRELGIKAAEAAKRMPPDAVCTDVRIVMQQLRNLAAPASPAA